MVARLREKYRSDVSRALVDRFDYANLMAVPKLSKIVLSMGMGGAHQDPPRLEAAQKQLALITGQQPVVTLARKAISNFKLRAGYKVGLKVTLRGRRMYEFLDRLISLAIPRVKDFRGLSPSSFDGRGNYNMGLVEQTVFPEVDPASVTFTQGMNISIHTTAETDEEARELLTLLGMPFRTN
ncbi:MAG TPA: 50S ribosomal protein L5 [Phycisphaerae bacterium]|nr:50S ribosomal protein L5 [Phycisphaerae bacterium]